MFNTHWFWSNIFCKVGIAIWKTGLCCCCRCRCCCCAVRRHTHNITNWSSVQDMDSTCTRRDTQVQQKKKSFASNQSAVEFVFANVNCLPVFIVVVILLLLLHLVAFFLLSLSLRMMLFLFFFTPFSVHYRLRLFPNILVLFALNTQSNGHSIHRLRTDGIMVTSARSHHLQILTHSLFLSTASFVPGSFCHHHHHHHHHHILIWWALRCCCCCCYCYLCLVSTTNINESICIYLHKILWSELNTHNNSF